MAVASSCIISTESTLAGGRFSVMRVTPCAVSAWMCWKLGALTGAKTSSSCGSSYSSAMRVLPLSGRSLGPRVERQPARLPQLIAPASVARRRRAGARGRGRPRAVARQRVGPAAADRDLEPPARADERARAADRDVRVGAHEAAGPPPPRHTSSPSRPRPASAARSRSRRFVVRLPNRSTWRTAPSQPSSVRVFGGSSRRTGSATTGPTSSRARPRARRAAAGPKRSRPWKTGDSGLAEEQRVREQRGRGRRDGPRGRT